MHAIVFVVFQNNFYAFGINEISSYDGRNAGGGGPVVHILRECHRKLIQLQGFILQLFRKNSESRSGFAIRRMKRESAEGNTVMHVSPQKSKSSAALLGLAGHHRIAPVADVNWPRSI